MKKRIPLLVLCALFLSAAVTAQKYLVPSKNPKTELKIADRFYAEGYFYTAVEYYKDAVRQEPENRYANFWLAMAMLKARDYENAEVFFRKFYDLKPGEKTNSKIWAEEDAKIFNKGRYYFGEVLHRNGKYDEAIEVLTKFSTSYKPLEEGDNLKDLAKLALEGCEYAKTAPKVKIKVKTLGSGINRSYTEAAPAGLGDSVLYYSSLSIDALSGGDTLFFFDGTKSKRNYALYKSINAGGQWQKGKLLENEEINEPGYTVGNGAFNRDQTRFYFTKCLEMDDDRALCNLFVADHAGGQFSNITRIPDPINEKEKFTATQPAVRNSADGMEIVYFVSDRDGGAGGLDIWYFLRAQNGEFKGPKLLTGPVNTKGDERTPFWDDSTKALYFSSNGHPGFGGFDIFKSVEQPDLTWGEVKNMGKPLNSGADDLYYSRSSDQTFGYVVSNREGSVPLNGIKTAADDVFGWANFRYGVQGMVFKEGEDGGGTLGDAVFKLYRKLEDGTKVLVGIDSTGKVAAARAASKSSAQEGNQPGKDVTSAIGTDGKAVIGADGKALVGTGATQGTPAASAPGSGYYFFKLDADADYVVEVEREGYQTKSEAITTKDLPEEDTIQNNMNMRKALYVLKAKIIEQGTGTDIVGATVSVIEVLNFGLEKTVYYLSSDPFVTYDIEVNRGYKLVAKKGGYFTGTLTLKPENLGTIDTVFKEIQLQKLELNKEYTLENILYEFGKATLTENSKRVLDNLYQILIDNSTFVIELSSHTDAIGSDAANMKLSQARAESCVNYLISKGIAKERMVPKGYGESKPKVPNTTEEGKDDPAGRAQNRRTEFKILKG